MCVYVFVSLCLFVLVRACEKVTVSPPSPPFSHKILRVAADYTLPPLHDAPVIPSAVEAAGAGAAGAGAGAAGASSSTAASPARTDAVGGRHGTSTLRGPASWSWFVWGITLKRPTPRPALPPAPPAELRERLGAAASDELLASLFKVRHTKGCQADASIVLPGLLHLCGADWVKEHAEELPRLGYTHVLNMAGSEIKSSRLADGSVVPYPRDRFAAAGITLQEHECDDTDRWCHANDVQEVLDAVISFVDSAKAADGLVLVHCSAGQSRSGCAAIACVMAHRRWPLYRALAYVRAKRKFVYPGVAFMHALVKFEERLLGCPPTIHPGAIDALHVSSPTNLWKPDPATTLMQVMGTSPSDHVQIARIRAAVARHGGNVDGALAELMAAAP